jgi:hypothetical protein
MRVVTFYDLLGLDPNAPAADAAAAALWPNDVLSLTPGVNTDAPVIVRLLQEALVFTNVRPGVDPLVTLGSGAAGQITFAADVHVTGGLLPSNPFYLRSMPDLGIQLRQTDPDPPAQCFFALDGRGHEVLIERLPVKLFLKRGLAKTLSTTPPEAVGKFQKDKVDGFAYTLQDDSQPSEIDAIVRFHLTPAGDVILEPSVPLSLGPARFMGLPAKAVYDLQLIPSPNRRDLLEWTRNDIGSFVSNPPVKGAIGFRSIEIDFDQSPFQDLRQRVQGGAIHLDNLELVLEDVVLPLTVPILPIPSHGTFGFRRKISDRSDIANAYSLAAAPVQVPIYGSPPQGGGGGSSLTLSVDKLLIASGAPPTVELQASLIWQTSSGAAPGVTIGIDDDWTVFAGLVLGAASPVQFTIAGTTVLLAGLRFGVSVGRLTRGTAFKDSYEILGDLAVKSLAASQPSGGKPSAFKLTSLTGRDLDVVLRDIGWKLGRFSLDSLKMPDGVQLVFAGKVRIIVEETGWVEEPNGTPYFSFSGGVALGFGGGDAVKPSGDPGDVQGQGVGLRVRRLRFRTDGNVSQPPLKLDGLFLNLHYGTVFIQGFGFITADKALGFAIDEWGFGVRVQFSATAMTFNLAAEFIKGSRRLIANPANAFDYFLASLELSYLPAGPYALYDLRLLLAENMAPNLDSQLPDGEGMALLQWHQGHDNALTMPPNRNLADWVAERDALSFGVGCSFSLNSCGKAMKLDLFIFFSKSKADTGLLIVGDLFILQDPKPIAFVAVEYDVAKEKFGVMIGVDLTLADFASGAPPWLGASLTGTLYFGNQPWSFAIGQLADQRSWLSIHASWNAWLLQASFQLGVCIQVVDGGPKGFGVLFTASASADWGIGSFVLFGSFGFIVGTWKTGSDTAGAEAWLSFGFKINLFFVFSFGADISVRVIYLHGQSWYVTASAEIRIDTPWYLPDVTFHIDKTWSEPLAFKTSTLTTALATASALEPGSAAATDLLVPALSDGHRDPQLLYTFDQLTGISGMRISDPRTRDLPIVSTDATIAINFGQPLANDSAIATGTYDGTTDLGVQRVQDLKVRYGLRSIAVRRSPRFGPTAGTWSDLVKESDTAFAIGGAAPQTLTFAWDVDSRADGRLSPLRLLLNSDAPYSFAGAAARNDEEAVRNDPGYPCCSPLQVRQLEPKSHRLDFADLALGSRVPAAERFSGNGAWWHWMQRPAPVVGPGAASFAGSRVARFFPAAPALVGLVDLPEPAAAANLTLAWDPHILLKLDVPIDAAPGQPTAAPRSLPGRLLFEGYSGLDLAALQSVPLISGGSTTLSLQAGLASQGLTRLVLRVQIDSLAFVPAVQPVTPPPPAVTPPPAGAELPPPAEQPFSITQPAITILEIDYVGLRDTLAAQAGAQQCKNAGTTGPPTSDAKGKLAFLPNHDYEVVVTTAIELSTAAQGARSLQLSEPCYFCTKGLPGLNAAPSTGDDLRRHVESTYPPVRAVPLYREEPVALAFAEGMSSVLPIDRAPALGAPPERAQMFPLLLNVDRVVSLDGLQRLTIPSDDWIADHRTSRPPLARFPAEPRFAKALVRRAASLDPLVLRHEAVRLAFPACAPPQIEHASQVLLHEPIDAAGSQGAWEAQTGYRATVRQKGGPFTERTAFDALDLGAFTSQADGAAPALPWSVDGAGNLVAPAAGAGRQYAVCGEPGWDHLQVQSQIDLRGAAAGIAVGVGAGTPVPQAILATVEADGGGHALVLRRRDGAGEAELIRAAVAVNAPLMLSVIAFDDNVRATVGDVVVEAPRGAVREGRVALVASGPAAFAGIRVDGLDMYTFDFQTSRYLSFQEHIGSYDGRLGLLASGAFGGAPATLASVLAAHGAAIGPLMAPVADPQERQKLFATMVAALGIGVRKSPTSLAISRLTDASGTYGLLVESCEPIPLTRDAFIGLIRHGTGAGTPALPPSPPPSVAEGAGPLASPSLARGPGGGSSDVSLGMTPLTNGDETIALLLPQGGTPLPAGRYALRFVLNRPRWRASGATDPEQVYTQVRTLELQW